MTPYEKKEANRKYFLKVLKEKEGQGVVKKAKEANIEEQRRINEERSKRQALFLAEKEKEKQRVQREADRAQREADKKTKALAANKAAKAQEAAAMELKEATIRNEREEVKGINYMEAKKRAIKLIEESVLQHQRWVNRGIPLSPMNNYTEYQKWLKEEPLVLGLHSFERESMIKKL